MDKDEALKMAIAFMETLTIDVGIKTWNEKHRKEAVNACYKALEQPAQEGEGVVLGGWQLRYCGKDWVSREVYENSIKQPAQEPFVWWRTSQDITDEYYTEYTENGNKPIGNGWQPLYTHPHQWQGLTELEQWNLINKSDIPADYDHELLVIARAIEQALKQKNEAKYERT